KCLSRVAEILTNASDVFGAYVMRYGGEEFAIFLENFTEKDGEETARRIMDELADAHIPHETSPVADHLTVSIGIASERRNIPREINALMERADEALYEVKRSGGNMFRTMQW
ncbi:MAG: GGDEF domain-containing protein, partial [Schwartzia sp.]|nr:GGDEF domain-containing protein [Schwartzia sp. (in: firmicutes)]